MRRLFIEFDKAGAEWVVVAYLSGDANMLAVVESGESPHPKTGAFITGVSEELIIKESKIVGLNTDPDKVLALREEHLPELLTGDFFLPRSMSIRQMGKKSNHGLNYDESYVTFSLINEMLEAEAKRVINLYRTVAYPGIPIWYTTIKEKLRKDRTLENCFGRKRIFRDAWGPDLFRAAYAQVPQSTVFDITRIGMEKITDDVSKEMWELDILSQVHDSVLTQYPIADLQAMARVCVTVGLDYLNPLLVYNSKEFKIATEAKVGWNWGHMEPILLSEDVDAVAESIAAAIERLDEQEEG